MSRIPLILLPGIGTDARVYSLVQVEFPQLVVPPWIPPLKRETLPEYAARLARAVNPGGPCYIGGLSFGGMVALEMSRHLDARACFLISSIASQRELPYWAWLMSPGAYLLPRRSDLIARFTGAALLATLGPILPRRIHRFCQHLKKTESTLLPWACRAAVSWRATEGPSPCPVHHIHGDADPIFPVRFTRPERVVPGGGHVLPLTHPYVVIDFLRQHIHE